MVYASCLPAFPSRYLHRRPFFLLTRSLSVAVQPSGCFLLASRTKIKCLSPTFSSPPLSPQIPILLTNDPPPDPSSSPPKNFLSPLLIRLVHHQGVGCHSSVGLLKKFHPPPFFPRESVHVVPPPHFAPFSTSPFFLPSNALLGLLIVSGGVSFAG